MCAIFMSLLPRFRGFGFRHAVERIPAPVYLASSYYERWLIAMMTSLVEQGHLTSEELMSRGADPVAPAYPVGHFDGRSAVPARKKARFAHRDRVVARNINYRGHTRLPRYVRGKRGVIDRDWGVYAFPDSSEHDGGERMQHVYSVAFEARELWGGIVPRRDTLRIDLWEDYLDLDTDQVGAKSIRKKALAGRRKEPRRNKR